MCAEADVEVSDLINEIYGKYDMVVHVTFIDNEQSTCQFGSLHRHVEVVLLPEGNASESKAYIKYPLANLQTTGGNIALSVNPYDTNRGGSIFNGVVDFASDGLSFLQSQHEALMNGVSWKKYHNNSELSTVYDHNLLTSMINNYLNVRHMTLSEYIGDDAVVFIEPAGMLYEYKDMHDTGGHITNVAIKLARRVNDSDEDNKDTYAHAPKNYFDVSRCVIDDEFVANVTVSDFISQIIVEASTGPSATTNNDTRQRSTYRRRDDVSIIRTIVAVGLVDAPFAPYGDLDLISKIDASTLGIYDFPIGQAGARVSESYGIMRNLEKSFEHELDKNVYTHAIDVAIWWLEHNQKSVDRMLVVDTAYPNKSLASHGESMSALVGPYSGGIPIPGMGHGHCNQFLTPPQSVVINNLQITPTNMAVRSNRLTESRLLLNLNCLKDGISSLILTVPNDVEDGHEYGHYDVDLLNLVSIKQVSGSPKINIPVRRSTRTTINALRSLKNIINTDTFSLDDLIVGSYVMPSELVEADNTESTSVCFMDFADFELHKLNTADAEYVDKLTKHYQFAKYEWVRGYATNNHTNCGTNGNGLKATRMVSRPVK
jgi:hypothetical protein